MSDTLADTLTDVLIDLTSVQIVTTVVMGLASHGLINDNGLTQERADVIFDSVAKDVKTILRG